MLLLKSPEELSALFPHRLPTSRLGKDVGTVAAFQEASSGVKIDKTKEYSLVMVTEPATRRILLGHKHRGFGTNMFNSFGGKLEENETDVDSAIRELEEETGISLPSCEYIPKVGKLHFTFSDSTLKMLVHVFRVDVDTRNSSTFNSQTNNKQKSNKGDACRKLFQLDPDVIRPCEEITPKWFANFHHIPLDNMFADDSLWLTQLLAHDSDTERLYVEGYFHFEEGGQEVNSISYYCMDFTTTITANIACKLQNKQSLERRLFNELHRSDIQSTLSIKEFKEAYQFANAVKSYLGKIKFDVILDVAGGHGALAAILLLTIPTAKEAIVIDPAQVGSIVPTWGHFFAKDKQLSFRYECLRTGLPAELQRSEKKRILVVACHACQHLSEEVLAISLNQKVGGVAVMPCCQVDPSNGSWKQACKKMNIPMAQTMDLLLAGKCMSRNYYDVRMKFIDAQISPQNRIILCRLKEEVEHDKYRDAAHRKLERAYQRSHANGKSERMDGKSNIRWPSLSELDVTNLLVGFGLGCLVSLVVVTTSTSRR